MYKNRKFKVGARKTAVIDFKSSSEAQNFRYSLLRKMSLYWSFYVWKYRFPSQNKNFCRKLGFFMDNFFCFGWYSGQVNAFRKKWHIFRILKVWAFQCLTNELDSLENTGDTGKTSYPRSSIIKGWKQRYKKYRLGCKNVFFRPVSPN